MFHDESPRLAEERVVGVECRTDRATGIARSGMNVDFFKADIAENLPVRHTIQTDSAGNAKPGLSGLALHRVCHVQK